MIDIGTYSYNSKHEQYVVDCLRSGMLSSGKYIEYCESQIPKYYGKKYGVMVNSGQSALEVALTLANVKFGRKNLRVLVPATTYAATLWAVVNTGNIPVFCDITENYVLDWEKAKKIEHDIALPVDLCGYAAIPPSDYSGFIIEDACEAYGNQKANYGDIICHSFYVSHIITGGCGGLLCLDDEFLYEYTNSYIAHGRTFGGDFTKYKGKWVDRFLFDKVGVSYRLSNLNAALIAAQLADVDAIVAKRKANVMAFRKAFLKSKVVSMYQIPNDEYIDNCIFQFLPIVIINPYQDRIKLLDYLYNQGIASRVLLSLTNQSIFKNMYGEIEEHFPYANMCNKQGFLVGCHQDLNEVDMKYIVKALEEYAG